MKSFYSKALGATLALLAAATAPALLGGFGVSVTLPKQDDPRTKNAVLVVQPIGCHGPGALVAARAEGIEKGVRRSIQLKLEPLPGLTSPGAGEAYMVKREWPSTGNWVLVFTAQKDTMRTDAIVTLDHNGKVQVIDHPDGMAGKPTVLSDGKTKLTPWSFTSDPKVVAMYMVSGDLKAAVNHTLRSEP
jgi:hypothetical protein